MTNRSRRLCRNPPAGARSSPLLTAAGRSVSRSCSTRLSTLDFLFLVVFYPLPATRRYPRGSPLRIRLGPVPHRRLTATLSIVLLGHLLVAQSLLACGVESRAHGPDGGSGHCHVGAGAHSSGTRSSGLHLTTPPSEHSTDSSPCCTVALTCASSAYVASTDRADLPAIAQAAVPVSTAVIFPERTLGPEPPPPK